MYLLLLSYRYAHKSLSCDAFCGAVSTTAAAWSAKLVLLVDLFENLSKTLFHVIKALLHVQLEQAHHFES